jgi:hypothetical protein
MANENNKRISHSNNLKRWRVILTEIDELVTRLMNNKREIEGDLQRKRRKIGSKEGKVK